MTRKTTDSDLGKQVHKHLISLKLENAIGNAKRDIARDALKVGLETFFECMGMDPFDESIADSPIRIATMFVDELCKGLDYNNFPKCTVAPKMEAVDEIVIVDSINTVSLCEHHFQTIVGLTHIAYLPNKKLLGLSKFARITDFFARRPQVQERMTAQIAAALQFILRTEDVAVQQICVHNCMRARGVMDPHSRTTTSKMGGRFLSNPALRQEFLYALPK